MNKALKLLIWPILLAPIAYLLYIWSALPERVAVHFNLDGDPDRFGSKNELIYVTLGMTALSAAIFFLLPYAYKIDPKKHAIENKPRLHRLAFAIAVFISFISCLIVNSALKSQIKLDIQIMFGAMGLFWCILGNYLYNIKPNYFAGYRLPWTLSNEDNWKRTHWLAAKLLFAGGLLIVLAAIFLPKTPLIVVTITIAAISMIIPIIYSYRLFTKHKAAS